MDEFVRLSDSSGSRAQVAAVPEPVREAVGLGDSADDLQSLRSAGINAVAAGWNAACHDRDEWDAVALTPGDYAHIALTR